MVRFMYLCMGALCVAAFAAGCGEDGKVAVEAASWTIMRTSPADTATSVNLNPVIQVWFDRALDEASIGSDAVHVDGAQTHLLKYDDVDHSILLYLKSILEPDSTYRVIIKRSIANSKGDTIPSDVSFEFTTGPLDCEHLEDYFEPNEDPQSAPEIELGRRYTCLSSCGADERLDYYRFTVESPTKVTAFVYHSYSSVDTVSCALSYARADGAYYGTTFYSMSPDGVMNKSFSFLPGSYLVGVEKAFDDPALLVYDLRLRTGAACEDDIYEDNDFVDEAKPLSPGLTGDLVACDGDADFFAIHLESGQTLTATATQVTDFETWRLLCIRRPDGYAAVCTSSVAHREPLPVSWEALDRGTHYVELRWSWEGVRYELHIDVAD